MVKSIIYEQLTDCGERYICGEKMYDIIGKLHTDDFTIPIVDIHMMSDEKWNELARKQKKVYNDEKLTNGEKL